MDTISPRLIGFAGRAGSGKSLAAEYLIVHHGYYRVKFADILKGMLRAFYEMAGLEEADIQRRLEGDLKELPDSYLSGRTPRHAMQTLGGDWGRDAVQEDLWVNAWKKRVVLKMNAGFNVVVDDLRYANEEAALRELGGEIYDIERDLHKDVPNHPSELHKVDADQVIKNNSTLTDLSSQLHRIATAK